MRVAYLMTVHKNPRLLQKLIAALSSPDCGFFIHIDRKSNIQDFSSIHGNNIHFLGGKDRMAVYWGEFSQVEATLALLRHGLGAPGNYDYFALLHGSDYPLRSGKYIERFLDEHRGFEFMSMVKIPAPGFPLLKVNKLRYPSDKPIRRFGSRALGKLGLSRRDYRKHLKGMDAYAGDACWVLTRNACEYIVEFVQANPSVADYFRNTFTSDEAFFHTILGNSAFASRIRKSLLYTDWPRPDHPSIIGDTQISFFEQQEKVWVEDQFGSGEALFARKFSDDHLDVLQRIDEMIERKEGGPVSILPK